MAMRGLLALGLILLLTQCAAGAARDAQDPPESPGAWLTPPERDAIAQVLANAGAQGITETLVRADVPRLSQGPDQTLPSSAEAQLYHAVLRYAEIQHGAYIGEDGPREDGHGEDWPKAWALPIAPYDAHAAFEAALARHDVTGWLESLTPPFADYQALAGALARYRHMRAAGGWPPLAVKLPLKPGMTGPAVGALRQRLAREGLEAVPAADETRFDPALGQALAKFQESHGLDATGVLDRPTLEALNVPVEKRIAQIIANLARWRWMPRDLPATRVEVNIAAQRATLFEAGLARLSMRTIVGRVSDPTPMLKAEIRRVIVNPPWNVPPSIARREILPKARRDPDYLKRENFEVITQESTGAVRIRQRPGAQNALGRIKFDMPNAFDVYLHDTPARTLFARERRALSHGCVRLEKPLDLALALLKDDPDWAPEALMAAIMRGTTTPIVLVQPVPVYLLYWTAFVGADGTVNFRDDIYGWDERLLHGLAIG